jgi:hypothetical protein
VNTNNLYINEEQFFQRAKEERLLDDFQIQTLKINALEVDHVFLDYFVPVRLVDDMIKYCREKIEYYQALGSISKVECYVDFINMLKTLSMEADEE